MVFHNWGEIKLILFSDDAIGPSDKGGESKLEQELNPIKDSTREHHVTATALPLSVNPQSNLKGFLLHETLLTKNFEGDQQFFKDNGHPASSRSSYMELGDPVGATHVVPHEDSPAFSDIATAVMTTASPTSPGKLVSIAQNKPKRRIEGKVEVLGGQVVTASSLLRTVQRGALPKTEQSPRVDFTQKELWPVKKSIMGIPTDMDSETTMTSIIHTTTVISSMREQGMCISLCCPILSFG